jgi:hypothetical protein
MKTEIRTINPDMARDMLKRNVNNRPLNQKHVDNLTHQMKSGQWIFDGTPIKLAESGSLLDGQHRLHALTQSDMELEFLVLTGIKSEAFKVMDTGRNRQASDVLGIAGIQYAQELPTVVRGIMNYHRVGSLKPTNTRDRIPITNTEILQFASENVYSLSASISFVWKFKRPIVSKVKLASLHYLFCERSVTDADHFISKLCTGLDLAPESPIYVLREKLISDSVSRTKMPLDKKYAFIVKCWNMHRKNESANMRIQIPQDSAAKIL